MKAVTINYRGKTHEHKSSFLDENIIVDIKVKKDKEEMCTGNVTYTETNLTKPFMFAWYDEFGEGGDTNLSDWSQDEEEEHEPIPWSDMITLLVEEFFGK